MWNSASEISEISSLQTQSSFSWDTLSELALPTLIGELCQSGLV